MLIMAAPHLTFFVELDSKALTDLFANPAVADFLIAGKHAVSMGLLDLTPERAAVVRHLEANGVAVTAWLLLDIEDGYWLNADNSDKARARYLETAEWAAREGLHLHRIGLDIEFPRADADLLMRNPRTGFRTLLRRRRSVVQVRAAERVYAELVDEIRCSGRTVETYHFPHLLDERLARTSLLRRTLGLVDLPADAEVFMLYASYLGKTGARVYHPEAPCIALGVTGGGVNAGTPEEIRRLLSWEQLEQELLAAAAHTTEVYVFSLEGCVEQAMLERLAAFDWNRPSTDVPDSAHQRARRWRTVFRTVLRAEPLFDLLYPSRLR